MVKGKERVYAFAKFGMFHSLKLDKIKHIWGSKYIHIFYYALRIQIILVFIHYIWWYIYWSLVSIVPRPQRNQDP
jgi:hypothetical protein